MNVAPQVTASVSWITVKYERQDSTSGVLHLRIDTGQASHGEKGEVRLAPLKENVKDAVLKVVLHREPVWQVRPDILKISSRGSQAGQAEIVPVNGGGRSVKEQRVQTLPQGLEVKATRSSSGVLSLSVKALPSAAVGVNLIEIGIRDDRDVESIVSLLVVVKK